MKKSFLDELGNELVSVTSCTDQKNTTYRFIFKVGCFTFGLDGTETDDEIAIHYPTLFETLQLVPIQLHNDEELKRLVLCLLELSEHLNGQLPLIRESQHAEALGETMENVQAFEEACRRRGAVTYENTDIHASLGHDVSSYEADKPYILFYQHLGGYHYEQTDRIESEQPKHVYPNGANVSVNHYYIHIHDAFFDIDFVIINDEKVHYHFPVFVFDKNHKHLQTIMNMEQLIRYANRLFEEAEKKAQVFGLSVYSYNLLQTMKEDNVRSRLEKSLNGKKRETVPFDKEERTSVFSYKKDPPLAYDESDDLPF